MKHLFCSLCLLFLGACGDGPEADFVHRHIQQTLNHNYGDDVIHITKLDRRGSQPHSVASADNPAQIVYFKVHLQLQSEHNFSEMDSIEHTRLHDLLGAASEGIQGLKTSGNLVGEELVINGLTLFVQRGGAWQPILAELPAKNETI